MTLQAQVNLSRVFLSLAATPSTVVSCGSSGSIGGGGTRSDTYTQEGSFRAYANGVTRLILGAANSRVNALTLRALTPTQVDLVQTMLGKTCLFRDSYGRRFFGSFLITSATDLPLSGDANSTLLTDVAINFQQLTYVEGV